MTNKGFELARQLVREAFPPSLGQASALRSYVWDVVRAPFNEKPWDEIDCRVLARSPFSVIDLPQDLQLYYLPLMLLCSIKEPKSVIAEMLVAALDAHGSLGQLKTYLSETQREA